MSFFPPNPTVALHTEQEKMWACQMADAEHPRNLQTIITDQYV